jgi:hypothetical protein
MFYLRAQIVKMLGADALLHGSAARDAHLPHQPLHPLAIDHMTYRPQHRRHPPRAEKPSI